MPTKQTQRTLADLRASITPRPWKIITSRHGDVAVWGNGPTPMTVLRSEYDETNGTQNQSANGTAIAAVPELLAVLEAAQFAINEDGERPICHLPDKLFKAVDAAITKLGVQP